jgi:hypothetical protein
LQVRVLPPLFAPRSCAPFGGGYFPLMSQRRALGVLFAVLAIGLAGIAYAAFAAEVWPVAFAAAVLSIWLTSMAARGLAR